MISAPKLPISEFFDAYSDLKKYLTPQGRADCSKVDLTKEKLKGANFSKADFVEAIFTEANLKLVCFRYTNMNQAVLTRAKLKTDQLVEAQFVFLKAEDKKTQKKITKAYIAQLAIKGKVWEKTMQLIKPGSYPDLETFIEKACFQDRDLLTEFLECFPEREKSYQKYIEALKSFNSTIRR